MKHLKTFESHNRTSFGDTPEGDDFDENKQEFASPDFQLEEDQVDDIYEKISQFVDRWEMKNNRVVTEDDLYDIFVVGDDNQLSDEFTKFLYELEEDSNWFNWDKETISKISHDLSVIIATQFEGDELEFPEDDIEEEEEGDQDGDGEGFDFPEEGDESDEIEQLRQQTYSRESSELNMDDILDKINDSGYESLTDEEKEFLSKQESRKILGFKKFKS